MTVAQRKQRLQRHIARLKGSDLARVEQAVYGLEPDEADLSAEDRRKIARMKRSIQKGEQEYATGQTVNWREVVKDV